jgi:hypothetical protein
MFRAGAVGAKNFSPIADCPTNFLPFSPISEGPIEAQSDIADHGYRTKCPPMRKNINFNNFWCKSGSGSSKRNDVAPYGSDSGSSCVTQHLTHDHILLMVFALQRKSTISIIF